MRNMAWTTMILFCGLVGCGGGAVPKTAIDSSGSSTVKESVVPDDVALLFEQGEVARAIEVLTSLIAKSPQAENLLTLRATGHHRLGHNEAAVADLDHAIAVNGCDAKLFNNRGFIRLGLEQFEAALADFDKATELSPKYMNAFNNRGLLYIAQKRYDDAINQFNHAIEIDNRYVDAYNNRGFAELEGGQLEQAYDDFNLAIQLNSNYVNAYNNRGLLRARVGDYENAVIDFTQAMMLEPLNPKYYQHRSEVYRRQAALDKAVADEHKLGWLVKYHQLTAAVAKETYPLKELTERARHFLLANDFDKALSDLDRALSLESKPADAVEDQEDDESDIPPQRKSIASPRADAYAVRAAIHLRTKAVTSAKADAEASLSIEPNLDAYSILGDVFLRLKDYDRAIENFAHARRVDPSVAEAYYAKAKALEEQGQSDQAKDNLELALSLDPEIESRLR